jgi:hypothetical protein
MSSTATAESQYYEVQILRFKSRFLAGLSFSLLLDAAENVLKKTKSLQQTGENARMALLLLSDQD